MRQHFLALAFLGSFLVNAAAFAAAPLENIPLAWKPTSVFSEMGTLDLSDIRKFFVTEDSTYNGEISLMIHVKDRSGKELWSGVVNGDATRWGRSYKAENYFEVMSDMILRAAFNMLSSDGFHAALAKP